MKTKDLFLRCYIKQDGNLWVAVCIDLGLAAQGDSMKEARSHLTSQIHEYLYDAIAGDDQEHSEHLLNNRKAPLSQRLEYQWLKLCSGVHAVHNGAIAFIERLPLTTQPLNYS